MLRDATVAKGVNVANDPGGTVVERPRQRGTVMRLNVERRTMVRDARALLPCGGWRLFDDAGSRNVPVSSV